MIDDTRSRLVESGLRLLREGGLDAVTLRAVGDMAGVSRTAPYRHFADKSALLATIGARIVEDLAGNIRAAVIGQASPQARLRTFYESYVAYALAHPREYRLVFAAELVTSDHPELATAIDRAIEALGLDWTAQDATAAGSPGLSKAPLMALLASAHGMAEFALAGHFTHKGLGVQEVIDALLTGFVPGPIPRL